MESLEETKVSEVKALEKVKLIPDDTPPVDLCFMLDCTGSMSAYILMSCNKIKDIIKQIHEVYPKSVIRVGIVAYRDIGDPGQHDIQPFTTNVEEARKFLDRMQASGGGDTPEDVNGAFQKVLQMKWESPVRLVVHIADAPCHGKEFHDCDDSYPKGHKSDRKWDDIFKELVDQRLDYLFLKISTITDKMFTKFKQFADKYGATEIELSFQQEEINGGSTGTGGKAKAEDHFVATISKTVHTSLGKEMKKGLQNKLNKRIEENAELVNKIKKSVNETVSKLDIKTLREKYGDLAGKVGNCILSSNDFIEAIADEDCLCLTFDIGRSQAAVIDPTQIIIKNVYPSFLTAGSFFYSTEFALKKNKLAHGGFEKHAEGLILKGAASENITGVMPLYFCEENWKVAKQLMKMTIAWDVTLDPLGYSYSQIKTVPFLILAKLAEMISQSPNTDFLKFQFDLVKQTCIQIMKDGSAENFENKFNEEIINLYNKYVEDPSLRTIDSIANNSVFLTQLYIVKETFGLPTKEEGYFEKLFKIMLEEELRRRQYALADDFQTNEWLFKLLNIDVENDITKHVNAFIESQTDASKAGDSDHAKQFLLLLAAIGSEEDTKTEEKKPAEETKTEEKPQKGDPRSQEQKVYKQSFTTDGAYNPTQTKAKEEYAKTLGFVTKYLYPLRMLFGQKPVENPESFKDWGIESDSQFFAIYIQNKLQHKNAGRREAFTAGTYRDPWTQSEDFIQGWYNRLIENEKASQITKFLTKVKENQSQLQAMHFKNAENLNEAAGLFLGTFVGVNITAFLDQLCDGKVPHAAEKIKMLITGHYKKVKLLKDAESWTPCRRNGNRLLVAHTKLFTAEEWKNLIPTLSLTYIGTCYKTAE